LKLHIGVDSHTGLAHSAVVTAANVHDRHPFPDLLHGEELLVYGDSAYASQQELIASKTPAALDMTQERVRKIDGQPDEARRRKNRSKSKIRKPFLCAFSPSLTPWHTSSNEAVHTPVSWPHRRTRASFDDSGAGFFQHASSVPDFRPRGVAVGAPLEQVLRPRRADLHGVRALTGEASA
jgi:hypothetical protein